MITKLLVLQHIDQKRVDVAQISGNNFQWTFHAHRSRMPDDPVFFPFHVNGKHDLCERESGDETILVMKENELIFCDDYGVPGDTVIGILFPKGYVPDIIKFKDKPYIPINAGGLVSTRPPGHLQVLYNFQEKRSAIVFNITDSIVFGFKCMARKVDDELFPHNESLHADHLFDVNISKDFLNVDAIQNEDLKIINQTLAQTDIEQIKTDMNALLVALKANNAISVKSLLGKITNYLNTAAGTTSALVTIADSYKSGNSAFNFIHQIVEYAAL
ncbi:hypothetical protein JN11_03634 [Mucilaginibacter frigoritolerans]|uniref:Uncharacterized protein n=1 Tax=Mucilaginibacter frigoritolerans TaxID=652788 RepID=A0A562TVQ6_9SPHI|nr:hypothetical protein [Mucilaginibacter frigoritolerans]TWI97174.1 hypothetical protein JN11_03634 [Mucilaginibacter frigoritolerans]